MRLKWYLTILLLFLPFVAAHSDTESVMDNMRGYRFCEVVLSDGWMKLAVYNTIGLNSCPKQKWIHLDKEKLKKETGALKVALNGPRYLVADVVQFTPKPEKDGKAFKEINMRLSARLYLGMSDFMGRARMYRPHKIDRYASFIYRKGLPVYELISPDKEVYVMQSYTVDKVKLTERALLTLDKQIKLPKGWQYKTGILKEDKMLGTEDGKTYVIQDSLMNSYQKASTDFL